jgi:hypothetical protein
LERLEVETIAANLAALVFCQGGSTTALITILNYAELRTSITINEVPIIALF